MLIPVEYSNFYNVKHLYLGYKKKTDKVQLFLTHKTGQHLCLLLLAQKFVIAVLVNKGCTKHYIC